MLEAPRHAASTAVAELNFESRVGRKRFVLAKTFRIMLC
jgi:hypothetical protein